MAEISLSLAQPPAAATDREHVAVARNVSQAPDEGPSADTGIAGADAATESARTIEANDEAETILHQIVVITAGALPR